MPVTPSPNRSRSPAFDELDADAFEEMTCALYDKELDVKSADLFRAKYQGQYGIDVLAHCHDGGVEVASCKCVGLIRKGQMDQWSTDFLKHWKTYWKGQGVRRFVLVVATVVNSKQRNDDIRKQQKRFSAVGISYEVWGPRQLQEKLRAEPGIVSQYLGPEWVGRLCGPPIDAAAMVQPGIAGLPYSAVSQLRDLQEALSHEIEERLDLAVDAIQSGNLQPVDQKLAALRAGPHWTQLTPAIQARVIRLQGSVCLQRGDLNGAARYCDDADAIMRPEEPRLRSLLAARLSSAEDGLRVLGEPVTRDGVHLKVALLLEADRQEDAAALLDAHPLLKARNAETERLWTFVKLLRGRRVEAFSAAQCAEQLAPHWPANRRTGAIARYALALSPMTTTDAYLGLTPIDLDLVREDDEARAHLQDALARFDQLATDGFDPESRERDEVWALACVSNLRDRLGEAEARCRTILSRTPTQALALFWALARRFEIDRPASIQALRERIAAGHADSQQALALVLLLDAEGKGSEAEQVLQETAALFDTDRARAVWEHWRAEFIRQRDGNVMGETRSCTPAAQFVMLMEQAQTSGDWSLVVERFRESMTETPPPPHALMVARTLASAGRWDTLVPHVDILLSFSTSEAVRLAVYAVSHIHQPRRVLEILDTYRTAFSSGALPNDLRRIEIEARQAAGDVFGALKQASVLAAESSEVRDQLAKARIHLRTGHIRLAVPAIRQAISADALSVTEALHLAQEVSLEDRTLARQLWRYAHAKGIPNEVAPVALTQALDLGIEQEAGHLFGVMAQLAQQGTGAVQVVGIEELVEHLRRSQEDSARGQQTYFDGLAPVHLIVGRWNINLAAHYRLPPELERPRLSAPLMIHHGARPLAVELPAPIGEWRIHMDITALLLANQLQLLEVLECLPHPIAIPPSLPAALQQLEGEIRPHQPHYLEMQRAILDAEEKGIIFPVDLPRVPDSGGIETDEAQALRIAQVLVDPVIIVPHLPPIQDAALACRFATLRAVVDGVYQAGQFDQVVYETLLRHLGEDGGEVSGIPPGYGATLFILDSVLAVITQAGALRAITQVYRVQIDRAFLMMAREEVAHAKQNAEIAAWLGGLRNRVAERLETGRYVLFQQASSENVIGQEDRRDDQVRPAAIGVVQCLYEGIEATSVPGAVWWADDRQLTSFQNNGHNIPIIGVMDVLTALKREGIVSQERYFDRLLQLRAAGAMFLPIQAIEVNYHLQRAPIVAGVLVETPTLAMLRRYVAKALLLDAHLKIGSSPAGLEGRPDETEFLLGLRRLAGECILLQWQDDHLSDEACRARSTWIWDALRVNGFLRQEMVMPEAERSILMATLQICDLMTGALSIGSTHSAKPSPRRQAFFSWVERHVLGDRWEIDPQLAQSTARSLASLLVGLLDHARTSPKQEQRIQKLLLQHLFTQFPPAIQQSLQEDAAFRHRLGIKTVSTITLYGHTFVAEPFWKAVEKALAEGKSRLRSETAKRHHTLRAVQGHAHTVRLSGVQGNLYDPTFALLDRDLSQRLVILENHLEWFDMPATQRQDAIREVCELGESIDRIDRIEQFRGRSAAWHYAKLRERLRQGSEHSLHVFLPPRASILMDHVRLSGTPTGAFAERLATAATALIDDYGPVGAFARLAGIPVGLPKPVLDAFREMPASDRLSSLEAVCARVRTPLQRLQALSLLRAVAVEEQGPFGAAMDQLLAQWPMTAKLFLAILKWVNAVYARDPGCADLVATDRLALVWTHADRLTEIILEMGFETDQVARDFDAHHRRGPIDQVLRLDPGYEGAAASPSTMGPECLLFHGLSYVCNGAPADIVQSQEQQDRVHELLTMEVDGAREVSPWLFVNREAANNDLGSFFTMRAGGLSPVDVSSDALARTHDKLLQDLEADPLLQSAWLAVWAFGQPALGAAERIRLLTILDSIDLVTIAARELDGIILCRVVVDCWSRLDTPESYPRMLAQLERLATHLAAQHPDPVPPVTPNTDKSIAQRDFEQLVEMAALSVRSASGEESLKRFGEIIVRLTAGWPGIAPLLQTLLDNVLGQETAVLGSRLWRPLLTLRMR